MSAVHGDVIAVRIAHDVQSSEVRAGRVENSVDHEALRTCIEKFSYNRSYIQQLIAIASLSALCQNASSRRAEDANLSVAVRQRSRGERHRGQ